MNRHFHLSVETPTWILLDSESVEFISLEPLTSSDLALVRSAQESGSGPEGPEPPGQMERPGLVAVLGPSRAEQVLHALSLEANGTALAATSGTPGVIEKAS